MAADDRTPRRHLPAIVRVHGGVAEESDRLSECGVTLPYAQGDHGRVCRLCQKAHDKKMARLVGEPEDAIEVTVTGTAGGKAFAYRVTGRSLTFDIANDWVEVPPDEPRLHLPKRFVLNGVRLTLDVKEPKVFA